MKPVIRPVSRRWTSAGSLVEFAVYIMSNNSMSLYTGVTNDVARRVIEHRNRAGGSFTRRYHFDRLVYFEFFNTAQEAIDRETQIKTWRRDRKIALIKTMNPGWKDLSEEERE